MLRVDPGLRGAPRGGGGLPPCARPPRRRVVRPVCVPAPSLSHPPWVPPRRGLARSRRALTGRERRRRQRAGGFLHVAFEGEPPPPPPPTLLPLPFPLVPASERRLGYYVLNRADIAGQQTVAAQLWKEYALSDSRYLMRDAFTVCAEAMTAVRTRSLSPPPPHQGGLLDLSRA